MPKRNQEDGLKGGGVVCTRYAWMVDNEAKNGVWGGGGGSKDGLVWNAARRVSCRLCAAFSLSLSRANTPN